MDDYPNIEEFIIDENVNMLDAETEYAINAYIEQYACEVERRQFEAIEQSKNIFINC